MRLTTVNAAATVNKMTYKEVLCDANSLYRGYKASLTSANDWKENAQRYMLNWLSHLFELQDSLASLTYKNSEVDEFELHERGRIRPITSLAIPDRIVRHVLCDDILMPEIRKKIIYDNSASITGRGEHFAHKRLEVHLHRYYKQHGNKGWILIGDFSKFYDNIVHSTAMEQLLDLVHHDEYIAWLLDEIFAGFRQDVSYMTNEEYCRVMNGMFNKLEYRQIPETARNKGEKFLEKSVSIGDQLSQIIGIYYPNKIDQYVKTVRGQKYYGRYQDDWRIISDSKEELEDILSNIIRIAGELGIFVNMKKTKIHRLDKRFVYLQRRYWLRGDGKIVRQINPKRVTAMRRKLKKLSAKVLAGEIPYKNAESTFKGWMGAYYKILSHDQRNGLISLYESLFNKKITINHGKMIMLEH